MTRRQPISSPTAAVTMARHVGMGALLPPAHIFLPDGALAYWDQIIASQPRQDWLRTPTLLATAASLASVQYMVDRARRLLDRGPGDRRGDAGAQAVAPQIMKLMAMELSLLRVLQLHGRAVGGPIEAVARRRGIAGDIMADMEAVRRSDHDGLLAWPKT